MLQPVLIYAVLIQIEISGMYKITADYNFTFELFDNSRNISDIQLKCFSKTVSSVLLILTIIIIFHQELTAKPVPNYQNPISIILLKIVK